jgi:serine phosphatase RsbU (regulator of sigma subunit)
MAALWMLKGPGAPQQLTLERDDSEPAEETLVGRDDRYCRIHLSHPCVSRKHVKIIRSKDNYALMDLKSKGGTFLNGRRLEPHVPYELHNGDHLQICSYRFHFLDDSPSHSTPAETPSSVSLSESNDGGITSMLDSSSLGVEQRTAINSRGKLQVLMMLIRELRQVVSLDVLLPKVLDSLLDLYTQADYCLMLLYPDDDRGAPVTTTACRPTSESSQFVLRKPMVEEALHSGKGVISEDRKAMCVPLLNRDEVASGVIQLDAAGRRTIFADEDLDMLATVAHQVSFAVENAVLHEAALRRRAMDWELRLAHDLQVELLPTKPPVVEDYEFADYYAAAQHVGGDYYDYIELGDGRLAIVLGDVSGKGIPAAMLMFKVSSELGLLLTMGLSPVEVLTRVNQRFMQRTPYGAFVTKVVLVLDSKTHELSIVNAGHLRPLLRRADRSVVELGDDLAGYPIGVDSEYVYQEARCQLEPNEVVALMSDGIPEARNEQEDLYEWGRVIEMLKQAPEGVVEVNHAIIEDIDRFVGDQPQSDDRCLLTMRRTR